MLLKIFKRTDPGVIILVAVTSVVLWIGAFINPRLPGPAVYETNPMPLYGIIRYLIGSHPFPGIMLSFLVLAVMMFLVVNFNTTIFFINERTFLPAFIYLLFSALIPQNQVLNPVLPASLFLILALFRIMMAYRKPGIAYNFFDAGIFIGVGTLFYANLIWFGLLVIIGIALLRTINIIEIIVSMLGLAVPFIITAGLFYVIGKDIHALFEDFKSNLFGYTYDLPLGSITIIALIYTGLVLIVSFVFLFSRINAKKISSRKTFYLLLWGFILSLVLYFFLPSVSAEMIWITGIPASYFLVHYFTFSGNKRLPVMLFSGFFLMIILIQVFYIT